MSHITSPAWIEPYLEIDDHKLLAELVHLLKDGYSDEDLAARFGISEEKIHIWRTYWKLIRPEECPHCGAKEYNKKDKLCPNRRCISNWDIPSHWKAWK